MISTANQYLHLGKFSDLVGAAESQQELYQPAELGIDTVRKVREVLGFCAMPEEPQDVRLEYSWEKDGLIGEAISWWVGYGPRTQAWLFKPAGSTSTLPGVLALHDHGGFKYYGKEKIAVDESGANSAQLDWFASAYGGRAWVNALAKRGFVVLVHDAFLWGSRKFPLSTIRSALGNIYPPGLEVDRFEQDMDEIQLYNFWAGHHEHLVEKYCNLLGTCLAGVVSHEDRIALNYLASREDVQTENLGCLGLSGGGNRSVLLRSTADGLKAAGVVGLMSTYPALLDRHVATHTWMFFPSGWARFGDWPDIAASRAPAPLLVQYDTEDELFTMEGMQAAHQKLSESYARAGNLHAYTCQFYPGPHKFDIEMQEAAFNWLEKCLKSW